MISFPNEFTATKLPGYFWNVKTQTLYSIKVSGILHELSKQKPNHWNHYRNAYQVSHKGKTRYLDIDYLRSLKIVNSTIPVE